MALNTEEQIRRGHEEALFMRRRDDVPAEVAEAVQKKMTNVFLLAAALLLILKAVPAQACTVQLQWDGPSSSPKAVRAVADGCPQEDPSGNAFHLAVVSELRSASTTCRYDSQPCYSDWHFMLRCDEPGNYTAIAYKGGSAWAAEPFTVPAHSKPVVSVKQPYPGSDNTYRLPVKLDRPQFGDGGFGCVQLHRINGENGIISNGVSWCTNTNSGATVEFEIPLSGDLAPPASGSVTYVVTYPACDGKLAKDAVQLDVADPSCNACPECVGDPIRTSNGNMRYSDVDPLPGDSVEPFVRTFNSRRGNVRGYFWYGWSSPLDARASAANWQNGDNGRGLVSVQTPNGDAYVFGLTAGRYEQLSPTGVPQSNLRYDVGTGSFHFQRHGSQVAALFSATSGRILAYRDVRSGRETRITYTSANIPSRISDSWGNWAWTITTDATRGYVTKISREGSNKGPYLTFVYSSGGPLLEVRSSASTSVPYRKYEYDTSGALTAAKDGTGRLLESHIYEYGEAVSSIGPSGDLSLVQYARLGTGDRRTTTTSAAGATTDYYLRQIDGRWRTIEIVGRCATCDVTNTVFGYDSRGNLTHQQDGRGFVTLRVYDESSRLVSEEGPFLKAGCVADDVTCRFTPDTITTGVLSPTSTTQLTTYTYDLNWPEQRTVTTRSSAHAPGEQQSDVRTYDPATGRVLTVEVTGWTDIPARPETRRTASTLYNGTEGAAFNPGGAFSSPWLTLAQPFGFIKTADGPRTDIADVTTYVYYPTDSTVTAGLRGRLAAVKSPDGSVTRFDSYDTFGNVLRRVDPNGVITDSTYDALGRLLTATLPGTRGCDITADPLCATNLTMTYSYDGTTGPLRTVTRPGGAVTLYEYDSRGRRVAEAHGPSATDLRERQLFAYDDSVGRIRDVSLQANVSGAWVTKSGVRHALDRHGRTWRTFFPPYTTPETDGAFLEYGHDAEGNLRSVKDERHGTPNTEYDVDPSGAVVEVRQWLGANWMKTNYEYDQNGSLVAVTDPNLNRTTFTVDDFGQVLRTVSPVTGTTAAAYDAAGNLRQFTDGRGAVVTHTYDAANRLTQSVHAHSSGTETITRTYDDATANRFARGRLSSLTDPSGTTQYSYERRGLLRREDRIVLNLASVTSYKYDAAGNRTGITYPSGRTATYTYDFAGRQTGVTGRSPSGATETYATGATYLPFGPLTALTLGNGLAQRHVFDERYRVTTRTLLDGTTPVASFGYRYDAGSNILGITDNVAPAFSRTFEYDDLSRLTVANSAALWGAGSYEYDAMGNMTTARLGATVRTFNHAGTTPLLSSVVDMSGTASPSYDGAGNLLSAGVGDQRVYSARNLMWSRSATGAVLGYDYDGRNVRVSSAQTANGMTTRTRMTYDSGLRLLEYRTEAATPTNFIWFGDHPVAQATGATVTYTYTDHLGTPLIQIDQAKAVIWRAEYDPFGSIHQMRSGTPSSQLLRFPGQEAESGGDEAYNIFRWYRSSWGRYTQADPLGLVPTPFGVQNLYAYADANPIDRLDPKGLYSIDKKCADTCGPDNVTSCYGNPQKINCVKNLIDEMKQRVFFSSPCRKALEKAGKWQQVAGSLMPSNPYPKITCNPADCTGSQPRYFPASRSIPMCKWFFAYAPPQGAQSMLHEFLHDAGVGDGTAEQTNILTACFPGFNP